MTKQENEIERKLKNLDQIPPRNALRARSGRSQFARSAERMKRQTQVGNNQKSWWRPFNQKMEAFPMKLAAVLVILTLVLGGGGLSVAAAQASLPGDLFYPVKILSEDIQLEVNNTSEDQVQFSLEFANRRFEEIQQLLEEGLMPPDPVIVRWQNQLLTAMRNAIAADETVEALETIKAALQQQTQMMSQLTLGPAIELWKNQFQNQIKNQIGLVDAGITDPQELAKELTWMFQYQQQMKSSGESDQWMWMFQHQTQTGESEQQYQWQYQNQQQPDELTGNDQQNKDQNQENDQNKPSSSGGQDEQNNEQEQNGNGGSNSSQDGSQNNGGNDGNGSGGGSGGK